MKKIFYLVLLLVISQILLSSCEDKDSTTSPPPPVCDQSCQDEHVAYGLIDVFWFLWNQNIAGQPEGQKDITVNGPQGGTVHITGTTEVATNGINTLHLVFDFSNCKGLKEKYNLTFNGIVSADGTFDVTYTAISYTSSMLNYAGTVGTDDWVTNVDDSCPITINETKTTKSGTICGRTFSY
jgi:hypothetical protein